MTLSAFVHRAIEAHPSMGQDELMSRLRAAKSGDREAFDKVVLSCSRLVYNYVLRTRAWLVEICAEYGVKARYGQEV